MDFSGYLMRSRSRIGKHCTTTSLYSASRAAAGRGLGQAGWEADSQELRYSKGARPQKNRHLAIAEWPTSSGPADYVLFVGLTPLAAAFCIALFIKTTQEKLRPRRASMPEICLI